MNKKNNLLIRAIVVVAIASVTAHADWVTATITAGTNPYAAAVNPVTNKTYVANYGSNSVTVIDGSNLQTATVTVGSSPRAIAVNALTNKIYVANYGSASVTVIDGATNATSNVSVEATPCAIAVNGTTNRVYVAHYSTGHVTVINGATDQVSDSVQTGLGPIGLCVNPVTNTIYVANSGSNTVTVINGATNGTTPVSVGTTPTFIAANTVTNKIYVSNSVSGSVTVIDGATNGTTAVAAGTSSNAVAVNLVTDKIYVTNSGSNDVTVIDGATGSVAATLTAGTNPIAVSVNATSNKIYVANNGSNNITVIDGGTNGTSTLSAGTNPNTVTVNPVTNKIYVVNYSSGNVTVVDGTTNQTVTVATGTDPYAVAVNPVSNRIYVANLSSNNVTVIDGATNATTTVAAGTSHLAVAVNPVTNKIYVANSNSNTVTVIDGVTNATVTVATGINPYAVAVNPVTNRIYVANYWSNNVTVINGATNGTATVTAGSYPCDVAVNPVTNKFYVANERSANVTVIDVAMNTLTTVAAGTNPYAVAVNPVTNKIYVSNSGSSSVTVIDGATNATATVTAGNYPERVAVNPVTNKIYVANEFSYNVTVIDETPVSDTRLHAVFDSLPSYTTLLSRPVLTGKGVNRWRPGYTPITGVLQGLHTAQSAWSGGSITYGAGTDSVSWTWNWRTDSLLWGENFLCAAAQDAQSATTNNHGFGTPATGNIMVYPVYRVAQLPPVEPPILISPANTSVDQPVSLTFSWNAVPGASGYSLQISGDPLFSTSAFYGISSSTSQTGGGLSNSTVYYWRVNAGNSGGSGPWSSVWHFTTISPPPLVPTLSSPLNGAVDVSLTPALSWNASSGATSYSVQVSTVSTFSSMLVNQSGVTATDYQLSGLSTATVYYWRVNASNAFGASAWSTTWNFTTIALPATPVLSSPANGAFGVSRSPALSWNSSAGVTSYSVQVSTASDFLALVINDSNITSTTHTVSGLSAFALYFWRVSAVNAGGSSPWSAAWNFTTGSTGVLSSGPSMPREFSISGSSGTIRYALPVQCHVSLKYFDLRGRIVVSFINQTQSPGYYSLHIDNAFNSRGTLIRVFEAGSFVKKELIAAVR